MGEQETLVERVRFNALDHGLWERFKDGDRINHGAWLRARAEGAHVGTCRICGDYLIPAAPYEHTDGRVDNEAHCRACTATVNAPGGRILRRSSRLDEMPSGWWENRLKGLAKPMVGGA